MQLALTALSVTLTNAQSTSAAMAQMAKSAKMSLHNKAAMNDCMDTLGDSVDELKQSMETMTHLKGKNIGFQISSVQTWVSAALTDDDTCMEGFRSSGEDVKTEVRSRVMNVVHLTSNALGLVNGLSSTIIHSTP
ncbi:hypothetical protein LUZ60_014766 [Juncus effusus]|nr:hypothetical protein LUZ60_014766 [Juncus effusus]